MDVSKSCNNSSGVKCVYYPPVLNSLQELMWALGETTVSQHVQREKKLVSFETSITHLTVSYIFIALLLSWGYFVIFKLMVKSYFSYQ